MDVNTKASSCDYEVNDHRQHRQALGVSAVLFLLYISNFNAMLLPPIIMASVFIFLWHNRPHWARAFSFTRFLDHTQRCTTVGRTPVDDPVGENCI